MSEIFTKETIREKHRNKVNEIIQSGGGVEELVNYIMSRISTVISYERRKNELRQLRIRSENHEKKQNSRETQ